MRKIISLCLNFILVITISGCTYTNQQGKEEKIQDGEKIQIGMSFDSFVIERWQRDRDVFVSVAKELGAEVNVQNANGSEEEQAKQIEYFIEKKMDVIVIICIDSNGLKEEIKKAKNAGIKIIAYDRLINDVDVDLYISFDNEAVGTMMGKELIKNGLAGKNVIMLEGSPTDGNVALVEKGFRAVMNAYNVEILDNMYAEGWLAELAGNYIYKNMNLVEEAEAIMCGNDNLASHVVNALSEKRLAGTKLVVGQDADLEACQRIVEGTQLMTVYKPVEKLAKAAAEYAVALAKEEVLKEESTTIDDGSNKVPYIALEPINVTIENMDEVIIESGFHLKEDVYLNVPDKMPR